MVNRGIIWCPHCGRPHPLDTKICPVSAKSLERGVNVNQPGAGPQASPLVGTVVSGRYYVHRLIGSGGMGAVYEAENRVLRRMVALKVVRGAVATPESVAKLEREALLVSAVQHPNICDVYDFGALPDGSPFIVLERLYGETLAQTLTRKPRLPVALAIDVFVQMLSGLQAAHGAQIVHRDLKPQNVFLVDRLGCPPLVKLLDFGLARDVSGMRTRTITKPGALLGTLKYMAPEQLLLQRGDTRTDIFAIGIMLYESLVGRHPFEGASIGDFQANILRCDPIPFSERRPDLPLALGDIVDRCLTKAPDDRWQACVDVQRALSRVAELDKNGIADTSSDDPPSSSFG